MQREEQLVVFDIGRVRIDLRKPQADQLAVPVRRPQVTETTGLGAAFLAGLGTGVWSSTSELAATWRLDRRFEPVSGARDDGRHARWRDAVARSAGWARTTGHPATG